MRQVRHWRKPLTMDAPSAKGLESGVEGQRETKNAGLWSMLHPAWRVAHRGAAIARNIWYEKLAGRRGVRIKAPVRHRRRYREGGRRGVAFRERQARQFSAPAGTKKTCRSRPLAKAPRIAPSGALSKKKARPRKHAKRFGMRKIRRCTCRFVVYADGNKSRWVDKRDMWEH